MSDNTSPEILRLQQALAGKYSIEGEIGRGAMGIVLLGRDVILERHVAIKLLPEFLSEDRDWRDRFLAEARTAARLNHPNIVPIHSVEEYDGRIAIVMSYVDGESLGSRIRRVGRMTNTDVMRIVREVSWALAHAHAQGVVHRDIKPDNILLERGTDRALVTDFGVARLVEEKESKTIVGTVKYMSPEQARGEPVDGRSDLYSLAVTAYYCLTGAHPFEAETAAGVLGKQATANVPAIAESRPTVSRRFAVLIESALAAEPNSRPAGADEFAARISAIAEAKPRSSPVALGFVRETNATARELAVYATAAGSFLLAFEITKGADFMGYVSIAQAGVLLVAAGLGLIRGGVFFTRLRELLMDGYDHAAVVRAAKEVEEEESEQEGLKTSLLRKIGVGKLAFLTAGAWGLLASGIVPPNVEGWLMVGAALGPTALVATSQTGQSKLRKLSGWVLGSRFGRFLFKSVGVGIQTPQRVIPATEHTELVLAGEVEKLIAQGAGDAAGLGEEVAAVARKLARQAAALREAGDEVRVGEAVAALENLRLDLLRLEADRDDSEFAEILERARELGLAIESELEVDRILGSGA